MSFKPFFVHFNRPVTKLDNSRLRHSPRGFTAYITPLDERNLNIQGTWCASLDEFRKAEGRSLAEKSDIKTINKRDLPRIMAGMANHCYGHNEGYKEAHYLYLLKYVV